MAHSEPEDRRSEVRERRGRWDVRFAWTKDALGQKFRSLEVEKIRIQGTGDRRRMPEQQRQGKSKTDKRNLICEICVICGYPSF
ncbi:MAG: hypothetical protein CVU64_04990 [Deltaproteobacteria bacterium HGW-Deltaproteobacteria-21]|nr:MAG: hypothetical protein CVU64_04990 [Deltaproteobacteria bacterium HGW-Deltaproteobacteria-21]